MADEITSLDTLATLAGRGVLYIDDATSALEALGLKDRQNRQLRPRMESGPLSEAIEAVKVGDLCEVQIRPARITELYYLSKFHEAKVVALSLVDHMVMLSAMYSRSWGDDDLNRIFQFTVGQEWNAQLFSDKLLYALDSLVIVNHAQA